MREEARGLFLILIYLILYLIHLCFSNDFHFYYIGMHMCAADSHSDVFLDFFPKKKRNALVRDR